MSRASIPVDPFNPGQVFACLGFMEAAETLLGDAEAAFDWSESTTRFILGANGDRDPFEYILEFLSHANVRSLAPFASENSTTKWDVPTRALAQDDPFPFSDPSSPATLPAEIESEGKALVIDYWGDETRRDTVKFWGGGGGYPGAALARDAINLVRDRCRDAAANPFAMAAGQSSSFRFDWRRDYIPIDTGFSLNSHTTIVSVGFPVVELLAALGLTNARPENLARLDYRYGVVASNADGALFAPSLLRAALGCAPLPFLRRHFRMRLGWPAKEGQARAITTVTEEAYS